MGIDIDHSSGDIDLLLWQYRVNKLWKTPYIYSMNHNILSCQMSKNKFNPEIVRTDGDVVFTLLYLFQLVIEIKVPYLFNNFK